MITDFKRRNQQIIFYNTSPSVIDTFWGVDMEEFVMVFSVEELNEHLRGMYIYIVPMVFFTRSGEQLFLIKDTF